MCVIIYIYKEGTAEGAFFRHRSGLDGGAPGTFLFETTALHAPELVPSRRVCRSMSHLGGVLRDAHTRGRLTTQVGSCRCSVCCGKLAQAQATMRDRAW